MRKKVWDGILRASVYAQEHRTAITVASVAIAAVLVNTGVVHAEQYTNVCDEKCMQSPWHQISLMWWLFWNG